LFTAFKENEMIIGVPRETKSDEYRVGLLPVGVELLAGDGHTVLVESGAGSGSGFADVQYERVGAEIVDGAQEVFDRAELLVKVKEPQAPEIQMLRDGQVVFTYFHFASSAELTRGCLDAGIDAVAYETLRDASGRLPLLTPMSEVAGKMAVQEGAKCLEKPMMGRGILLGGVPGVEPASVLVLGAGVVGSNAARLAAGLGASVVLMDVDLDRLRYMSEVMPANVMTIHCDPHSVAEYSAAADLVIGAVLIPGALAPRLLTADLVARMKPGAVIVDVCIDQGGCVETSHPTTHGDPTFVVDEVVHYCVCNMPGAVGRTSSQALCNATLPYVRQLANLGVDEFAAQSPGHADAINMRGGKLTNSAVADVFEGKLS
jgi:alanine dehydrogenase